MTRRIHVWLIDHYYDSLKLSRILLKTSIFYSFQFNSFNNDLGEDMNEILIKSAVKMIWEGTQDNK